MSLSLLLDMAASGHGGRLRGSRAPDDVVWRSELPHTPTPLVPKEAKPLPASD
jgi:hypothetical protein